MGVAISGWRLASAVSRQGQFGVVSGNALAVTFAHRLQLGDPGGYLRDAMSAFPAPAVAQRALAQWFKAEARTGELESPVLPSWPMAPELVELTVLAVFAEVYLAKKHGERGPIGINLLSKVEIATLPSLYGAMLAGVDAVFMGAGIPRFVPGALDAFAQGQTATLPLTVEGSASEMMDLNPSAVLGMPAPILRRPLFFPIVSSEVLASILLRKSNGAIDGFIVEDHTAGGHNAPPRGRTAADGQPLVWDERDRASLAAFRKLGRPFYLAGGHDDATALRAAQAEGAVGVQIGTVFAFCEESGMRPDLKVRILQMAASADASTSAAQIEIASDPVASPTGFPFKVVQMSGTLSDPAVFAARVRDCKYGYLRTAYRRDDGTLGWRCPAEREAAYVSKGGSAQDAVGRRCLCVGLAAAAGFGRPDEAPIVTSGEALRHISRQLRSGQQSYSARDVVQRIIGNTAAMDVIKAYVGERPRDNEA